MNTVVIKQEPQEVDSSTGEEKQPSPVSTPVWRTPVSTPVPSPGPLPVASSPKLFSAVSSPIVSSSFLHSVKHRLEEVLAIPESSTLVSEKKTHALCQYYTSLPSTDKTTFLKTLSADFGVDSSSVQHYAAILPTAQERGSAALSHAEEKLRHVLIPKYQHLFTQISKLQQGVKFLVDMRADAITLQLSGGSDAQLHAMNQCLRDLLALWFSVGFLNIERITWQSPCDMLQKISEYEAVHPIRNWTDLKRRVGHNRRCFVFTHASMPREPVVVLHTALTNEISHSIQSIVHSSSETADGEHNSSRSNTDFTTAIFYSITSTQKGLQGVELGNYLIKSVVAELLQEFPRMHQFSSLSPIPGFKDWLVTEINQFLHKHNAAEFPELSLFTEAELKEFKRFFHPDKQHVLESVKKVLQNNSWYREPELVGMLRAPLTRLCARYLYLEKRRGFALNPVENFHLRNGAVLWRINWLADTSPRGLGASCSLMVNYRYFLHNTQQHSRLYMEQQIITASDAVLDLVRDSLPSPPHLSSASSLPPPTTQQQREDRTSTEEES